MNCVTYLTKLTHFFGQYQPKRKKCKHLRSYGVASGASAASYMTFVAAVVTLVLNINNNINANNNAANQTHPGTGLPAPGNCIAVSPHPNPPRLLFPSEIRLL